MGIAFRKMVAHFGKTFVSLPTAANPAPSLAVDTSVPISPNAQRLGKNERALSNFFSAS
jgi:hypothetical protein